MIYEWRNTIIIQVPVVIQRFVQSFFDKTLPRAVGSVWSVQGQDFRRERRVIEKPLQIAATVTTQIRKKLWKIVLTFSTRTSGRTCGTQRSAWTCSTLVLFPTVKLDNGWLVKNVNRFRVIRKFRWVVIYVIRRSDVSCSRTNTIINSAMNIQLINCDDGKY